MENTLIDKETETTTIQQSFYIISKTQNSQDIDNNLNSLLNQGISVIAVINPDENIHINIIEILEDLQETYNLPIILQEVNKLEETPFIINNYHQRLNIAGFSRVEQDSLLYIGEDEIYFDLFYIGEEPIYTLETIDIANSANENIALVSKNDEFNVSTFALASQEIEGGTLVIPEYDLQVDEPSLLYQSFYYVGDIAIIFFVVSIAILLGAIALFKKSSQENFIS